MSKYVCSVCGYIYDEAKGIPDAGVAPGTKWSELPEGWVCPQCGASKSEFREVGAEPEKKTVRAASVSAESEGTSGDKWTSGDMRELTALETSAVCSNLARGCEKQYKPAEAALFTELADYFKSIAAPDDSPSGEKLLSLIEGDLDSGFPSANAAASDPKDRGALRALVWSEKVTKILKSLLARYQKDGEAMLDGTGVYVCTICGFVYVGDNPPAICPVCKVPSWKFEKIEGRA